RGEAVRGFELDLNSRQPGLAFHVSIVRISGARADQDAIVHLLEPVDRQERLARELGQLGVSNVERPSPLRATRAGEAPLSPRERDVLAWMAEGLQNKEIAQKLHISLATVRNHVHNLLEKLGMHSKLEAVSLAYRAGWVRRSVRVAESPARAGNADPL